MKFKRSKLLSVDLVVGYLLFHDKDAIRTVKLRKNFSPGKDSHLRIQARLVKQQIKRTVSESLSQKMTKSQRRVFTIKELFEKYEQSYHNAVYLEAIKFLLEQTYWQNVN